MPSRHCLAAALLLAAPTAWAQGVPAPVPERPPLAAPGAEPNTRIPERVAPPDDRSGSDVAPSGVLRPGGNPDPGMTVSPPLPDPGRTRVIPPPGTPGGNPNVQPR